MVSCHPEASADRVSPKALAGGARI